MNRRDFVSRVTLGGVAAACTGFGSPSRPRQPPDQVNVRFVGMMTFVERADRSFLVATPGQHALHHMTHTPFLMARAGSPIAKAFGMVPAPGVVPAAFDTALDRHAVRPISSIATSTTPRIEIISGTDDAVDNHADEMALMQPHRARANAFAATSRSGRRRRCRCAAARIENSAAHPDAA